MGFIVEIIVWFIIELIFWGIMYWTGLAIAKVVTLGKWEFEGTARDKEEWKEKRRHSRFIFVAVLGALFWIAITLIIILITTGP